MERTSLITRLLIGKASDYSSLTLESGLPNAASLTAYFQEVPLVLEQADVKERTEDSPQGQIRRIDIRANIHRDSDFHRNFIHQEVMAYYETANGEHELVGNDAYPLSYNYERDSGAGNADNRFTTLLLSEILPV